MYLINFKNVPLTILNLYLLRTIIKDSFPNPGTSGRYYLKEDVLYGLFFGLEK